MLTLTRAQWLAPGKDQEATAWSVCKSLSTIAIGCSRRAVSGLLSERAAGRGPGGGRSRGQRRHRQPGADRQRQVERGADLLLVHHGFFWKGEDPTLTGIRTPRLQTLLAGQLSLLAYHLPLDAHPELGNNARWRAPGLVGAGAFRRCGTARIWPASGRSKQPLSVAELTARIGDALGRQPQCVAGGTASHSQTSAGVPERRSPIWRKRRGAGWMPSSAARFPSPRCTSRASTVFTILPPVTTPRSATGCRRWANIWPRRFGIEHTFVDIDNPV